MMSAERKMWSGGHGGFEQKVTKETKGVAAGRTLGEGLALG